MAMNKIELPSKLSDKLWIEYCAIEWGVSGKFKGFRDYIKQCVPDAIIEGNIREGFVLNFPDERNLILFLLRWI